MSVQRVPLLQSGGASVVLDPTTGAPFISGEDEKARTFYTHSHTLQIAHDCDELFVFAIYLACHPMRVFGPDQYCLQIT